MKVTQCTGEGVLIKANGTEFGVVSFTRSKVLRGAIVQTV